MTWKEYQKQEFNFDVQTTFWEDFDDADQIGVKAVKDLYRDAFEYAKTNYKFLTELSLVLNYRLWMHYDEGNQKLAKVYDEKWCKCHDYALRTLKGDEYQFYFNATD